MNTQIHAGEVDLLYLHQNNKDRYPFLLESVAHGTDQARYSILFAFPGETIQCDDLHRSNEFLQQFEQSIAQIQTVSESKLPFTGGWFVFLGYELVQGIEPGLRLPDFPLAFPVAFATRCPAAVIVDHAAGTTILISESESIEYLDTMQVDISNLHTEKNHLSLNVDTIVEDEPDEYLTGVKRIINYIRDGDVFQVNLSRAWKTMLEEDLPASVVYQCLRQSNPSPFACLVHHEQGDIISSSPERLVTSREGQVETRPIAGTRKRTGDDEDIQLMDELRTDHKERAEHVMLIDLERNDLGRICRPGSIEVNEMMILESYAHVHHIVSNVRGILRDDVSPVDIIRAVFPGGTITGCPKVRCMEIIAELEKQGRGPYTGSVGYVNRDGSMDLNILIRTIFKKGCTLYFRTGAGIVADSDPSKELAETRHKAKGLLLALNDDAC
ncbi:MAG: aminodeoxychorismate synthase component I [Gammaproteobacteria bacterium]|nr:MAG: aminodeoxychorismate synthase component I [Gammaproteobacteria bacterium]